MQHVDDLNDDDARLLDELARLYAHADPVPDAVMHAAHAAIELHELDAQLAELLSDSALEDAQLAGVRGSAQRLLSFGRGEQFVEVDVAHEPDGRALTGYVVPPAPGILRIAHRDAQVEAPIDEHGRFSVSGIARGLVRLRIELHGLTPLVTPWLPL